MQNDLILFDRGYPSKELMASLIDDNIKFVMRCSTAFLKDVNNTKSNDEVISFKYNDKNYKIRVVKFKLDEETEEVLAATVFDKSFTIDAFKILYFKRWGIMPTFSLCR